MHPAYSVIFFTVSSGAGFGLIACLAAGLLLGLWHPQSTDATGAGVALIVGALLAIAGLLSSTFHLGHPERAWRALSQWRSSWLSREGILALAALAAVTVLTLVWWLPPMPGALLKPFAFASVLLALATVFSTAMIYASLKTIPRWNQPLVAPVYLLFSLAAGAVLTNVFVSVPGRGVLATTALVLALAWVCKWYYWRTIDKAQPTSTAESATGLGSPGSVSPLDPPHTSANYVQKEMGYVMARKHALKLRRIAIAAGLLLPLLAIICAWTTSGLLHTLLMLVAALSLLSALIVERWLFFAEAEHVVTLFYGKSAV